MPHINIFVPPQKVFLRVAFSAALNLSSDPKALSSVPPHPLSPQTKACANVPLKVGSPVRTATEKQRRIAKTVQP